MKVDSVTYKNKAKEVTLELCLIYYMLGYNVIWNDGKDLTLEDEEKEPTADQSK